MDKIVLRDMKFYGYHGVSPKRGKRDKISI